MKKVNYEEYADTQLINSVQGRERTIMIGGINAFEEYFGHLWGLYTCDECNGETYDCARCRGRGFIQSETLDDNQQHWYEIWENCRKLVLDQGNNEIRATKDDMRRFDIRYRRFKVQFVNPNRRPHYDKQENI